MGRGVDSNLLAGLATGTGLVLAGFIGVNVVYPPAHDAPMQDISTAPPTPENLGLAPLPLVEDVPPETLADTDQPLVDDAPPEDDTPAADSAEGLPDAPVSDDIAADAPLLESLPEQMPESASVPQVESAPEEEAGVEPATEMDIAGTSDENVPQVELHIPTPSEGMTEDSAAEMPAAQAQVSAVPLPSRIAPAPQADVALEGPHLLPPAPIGRVEDAPEARADPEIEDAPEEQVAQNDAPQTMPGTRVSGLPRIGEGSGAPIVVDQEPLPSPTPQSALQRNSLYQAGPGTADKMALVLSDPGLPMARRRMLAALEVPFTIALNPMDPTAPEAAEIYHEAGKEVVILAAGLPAGATASDLDVSLNAYFDALPRAVGVIDLPENGVARNAALLREVLPLLAQDGHGFLTFSGGLSQAGRSAEAAGVAHAEVFRVLDAGDESVFTIRRFLDRAVFQASQIGNVIVFGDATNEETLDAIEMWREERRAGQITLVPVSGILLQQE